jgi:hypothetical protein
MPGRDLGRRADVTRRDQERIGRLEESGTMDRRREEIRCWFRTHPHASTLDAIRELRYSYPDHMYVIADSIRMDLAREHGSSPQPLAAKRT